MIKDATRLFDLLEKAAKEWPEREAVVFKNEKVDYRTLWHRVNCLAKGLLKLGIRKGDKVTVQLVNSLEWFYVEYALMKIGAILVPINTRYKPKELEHILKHSDAAHHILQDRFLGISFVEMAYELCPELKRARPGQLNSPKFPLLKTFVCCGEKAYDGMYRLQDVMEAGVGLETDSQLALAETSVDGEDIAHIPYTSGTTGQPKGVPTTHTQYLWFNFSQVSVVELRENDRLAIPLPFCHNYGNSCGIFTPAMCGGTSIVFEYFEASEVLRLIDHEKCTVLMGTPTMFIKMMQSPDFSKYDYSSLRTVLTAAAPAPERMIRDIQEKMGVKNLHNGYGMTENSVGTAITRIGDPPEIIATTVGLPYPGAEVRVVNIETGGDLPPNREGELCTRGTLVMKGYYKMPEESAKVIDRDGWFHTGDLAVIDGRGYIRITGRLKDVIMPGGMNYSPVEVEELLYTHPKIQQVSIVGIPDEVMGEVSIAFVQLKAGETAIQQEIIDFCKGKIANFKVPKYVKFVNEYPMTALGKIQKFILREQAIKELGLCKN